MSEKFKIIDTSSPYGTCYPYTPTPSQGRDATVVIYPPSKLEQSLAFAKKHDVRVVRIAGNPSAIFSLDFSAFESFAEIEVLEIWKDFKIGEVKGAEALEATQNKKLKFNRLPPALRCAKISKLSHENLGIFRDTPGLEQLELAFTRIASLDGIKGCKKLELLSVFPRAEAY